MVAVKTLGLSCVRCLALGVLGAALLGAAPLAEAAEKAFVYAIPGAPETLDSAKATSERSIRATWLLCEALLNISKDGQSLEPGLAESWTASPDGRQVSVKLRRGVLFHDGAPVDGPAVKASFERQFRPDHELYSSDTRNSKEKLLSDLVESIVVNDALSLTFNLKYPGLHYFSQIDVVSPGALARLGKDFGRKPVCTGPFKVDTWASDRLVLVANDKYWAGRPRLDRVHFQFVAEQRELVDGLLKGDFHFTPNLQDPIFLERIRESDRVKLLPVPGLNMYYLGFYTERPPFDDRLVRRAFAHSIDIPRMVLFLGRGAAVAAKGPLSPSMKGYDPSVSQARHDPAAARELLAKARFDPARAVTLVHDNAVTMDAEIAGAIQADLRRIGIKVEFLGKQTARSLVAAAQAREGDMFLYSWHLRAPYPERLLIPLFHSRSAASTNLTRSTNPMVDQLLDRALDLPDGPELASIYSRVQRHIVEDAPMVFLYHLTRMVAHSNRVRGLEMTVGMDPYDKLVRVDLVR